MAFLQDLRFGFRALTKSPAYTLVAIATLALAIGTNTVIFSFANVLVLEPLPLRDPDGLAWVYSTDPHSGPRGRSAFADYQSLRDRAHTLESLAATTDDNVTLTGRGEPMRLYARRVTGNFFDVWGLRPAAGRLLRAGPGNEDEPGGACTVVLSDRLWASLFQRDPSIVSTSLAIDGRSCTLVGVVEPAIEIGNLTLIDVWMPIAADALRAKRDERNFAVIGRMKPGATVDQVGADLRAIAEQLQREHPDTNTGWTTRTVNTKTAMMGEKLVAHHGSPAARRRIRAAHRLRERRESHAGARDRTAPRVSGPRRARRDAVGRGSTTRHREPVAWRRGGRAGDGRRRRGPARHSRRRVRAVLRTRRRRSPRARLRARVESRRAAVLQRRAGVSCRFGRVCRRSARGRPQRQQRRRPPQPQCAHRGAGQPGDRVAHRRRSDRPDDDRAQSYRPRLRSETDADGAARAARLEVHHRRRSRAVLRTARRACEPDTGRRRVGGCHGAAEPGVRHAHAVRHRGPPCGDRRRSSLGAPLCRH